MWARSNIGITRSTQLLLSGSDLTYYSSWASIISLFISLASLLYVRSIRASIIRFRRKQRLHALIDDVLRIPDDATPLSSASKTKITSLVRNIPAGFLSMFTERGRHAREIHKHAEAGRIADLKESINDWTSYSEDV